MEQEEARHHRDDGTEAKRRERKARDAKGDARAREIDRAVEEMRTGHQHHTGAERDQRYRLRQLQTAGSAGYGTGDGRSTERLDEGIAAEARQPTAHERADR